ncbi:hypothetical protein ACOSP7_012579 [Xanthoceras sorbifolium]
MLVPKLEVVVEPEQECRMESVDLPSHLSSKQQANYHQESPKQNFFLPYRFGEQDICLNAEHLATNFPYCRFQLRDAQNLFTT